MKASLLWSLIVLIAITVSQGSTEDTQCQVNNTILSTYQDFASKTSYFFAENENVDPLEQEGCTARNFWLIARHGTRTPDKDDIELMDTIGRKLQKAIVENHANGSGSLCSEDAKGIQDWTFNLEEEDDSLLTESGRRENVELGQRYKERLSALFNDTYDSNKITVRHTDYQRTEKSAEAFTQGMFPNETVEISPPVENDTLLRFYEFCPRWKAEVDDNADTMKEANLFAETDLFKDMLARVNLRLGFIDGNGEQVKNDSEINIVEFREVLLMYNLCRYESAWEPDEISAWCAVFGKEDLDVLAYYQDLIYYYYYGYNSDITTKFACPLVKDMASMMEDGKNNTKLAAFYFSHTTAVAPLETLLKLNKDEEHLRHDNYEEQKERLFRVSHVSPFTANVGFLAFDCEKSPKQRIMALVQERPVEIEGCEGKLCNWEKFKANFKDDISCPFESMCTENSSEKSATINLAFALCVLIFATYVI